MPASPGTVIPSGTGVSPGGDIGLQGPTAVSTDANNLATLGSDNKILVPASSIWSVRLRSFNAVGNPTMECDQVQAGASVALTGTTKIIDRWYGGISSGMGVSAQQMAGNIVIPGTNFFITSKFLRFTVTTAKPTLAANDTFVIWQSLEGPVLRELLGDAHSVSLLVRYTYASLGFGLTIQDANAAWGLTKLCATASGGGTWKLISLPNLPVFTPSGSFPIAPGTLGYYITITLAAGSSQIVSANDVWLNTTLTGAAIGQGNVVANVGATFDIAFVQHEPGSLCTQLIDRPFTQNLYECKRYFAKSQTYSTKPPDTSGTHFSNIGVISPYSTTVVRPFTSFEVELAKPPTMSWWSYNGAAPGSLYVDNPSPGNQAVTGSLVDTRDMTQINFGPAQTGNAPTLGQWTADTGW